MENKINNICKKILNVMKQVKDIKKDSLNTGQNYKYASDEAIVSGLKDAMIKEGLIMFPGEMRSHSIETTTSKEGKVNYLTKIDMEYIIVDTESGESIKSLIPAQGRDPMDKGVYKALTGAKKYFLLQTFMIATTDDAEEDNDYKKSSVNKVNYPSNNSTEIEKVCKCGKTIKGDYKYCYSCNKNN